MKISLGADHAGFALKEKLRQKLEADGYEVVDHGTSSNVSTDYPDYAAAVAEDVRQNRADRGLLICWTGVGMSIAANKIPGIRAAVVVDREMAELARRHNDANILALGAKFTPEDKAAEIVDVFLTTPFDGGRHERRIEKIRAIEQGVSKEGA
ncbi:MAG: ribose 5-phosphate isomerase B [Bryobacteraceae bacterium]|nr:ribose 5-phosphate isomerase B [Bryobacteraceae bacterium]MDW8378916.1 ribose 5-phosphate isomerase B [Bryobacterales bacterium]